VIFDGFPTILEHSYIICVYIYDVTLKHEMCDYVTKFSGLVLEVLIGDRNQVSCSKQRLYCYKS